MPSQIECGAQCGLRGDSWRVAWSSSTNCAVGGAPAAVQPDRSAAVPARRRSRCESPEPQRVPLVIGRVDIVTSSLWGQRHASAACGGVHGLLDIRHGGTFDGAPLHRPSGQLDLDRVNWLYCVITTTTPTVRPVSGNLRSPLFSPTIRSPVRPAPSVHPVPGGQRGFCRSRWTVQYPGDGVRCGIHLLMSTPTEATCVMHAACRQAMCVGRIASTCARLRSSVAATPDIATRLCERSGFHCRASGAMLNESAESAGGGLSDLLRSVRLTGAVQPSFAGPPSAPWVAEAPAADVKLHRS